jgi:hypothetical protein
MKRIFDIRFIDNINARLEKLASRVRSSSKFQIAYQKAQNGKVRKVKKSISADISYNSYKRTAKVDVHETSKKGHKNRRYLLKDISEQEFNKLYEYMNAEEWGKFFGVINQFKS